MIDRSWIGRELAPVDLTLERGRLRFFARAIGETDPVYTDVQAAQRAGYADLPAPPTFLFGAELDGGTLDRLLADLGVPIAKILHGEQGFTYHRPACAGETITVQSRIADIFDKKSGALEFVVKTSEARNAAGELVAELRSVIVVRH
ncbi:MaoC family dehydratase N-terminal domain-containing protein [Panacagrimonas sp.]|uniref:MaoC family dehydratase N-terminal domain-containing protein n=1 Tax=Panacagrimonas sp. TaxID=2480088 RepID=UPI003B5260EF